MTTTVFNIIPSKYAEDSQTVQYTVSSPQNQTVRAVVDTFTLTNVSGSAVTFSCNLVNKDGSAGNDNLVLPTREIQPNETYLCPELIGQVLEDGAFISTLCSAANALVMRASGREITT